MPGEFGARPGPRDIPNQGDVPRGGAELPNGKSLGSGAEPRNPGIGKGPGKYTEHKGVMGLGGRIDAKRSVQGDPVVGNVYLDGKARGEGIENWREPTPQESALGERLRHVGMGDNVHVVVREGGIVVGPGETLEVDGDIVGGRGVVNNNNSSQGGTSEGHGGGRSNPDPTFDNYDYGDPTGSNSQDYRD